MRRENSDGEAVQNASGDALERPVQAARRAVHGSEDARGQGPHRRGAAAALGAVEDCEIMDAGPIA